MDIGNEGCGEDERDAGRTRGTKRNEDDEDSEDEEVNEVEKERRHQMVPELYAFVQMRQIGIVERDNAG